MWSLVLRVATPSQSWCHRTSLVRPDVRLRVMSCMPRSANSFVEVVELRGHRWPEALDEMGKSKGVNQVDVLESSPETAVVRLQLQDECPLPRILTATGVPPQLPFEVRGGFDHWLVVSRREEAQALLGALRDAGAQVELVYSGSYAPEKFLTDRQRQVLEAAVAEGYYDYPRRTTLTKLAEKLGVAKSTLSETLMLVERDVIGNLVRGEKPGLRPPRP